MKESLKSCFQPAIKIVWYVFLTAFAFALISFPCSLTYVDNYELGYSFDKFNGTIDKFDRTGWFLRPWWQYEVNTVDLRPYQVSISANQRVLNAKLVRFNPEGLDTFLEWHGRGAGEEVAQLKDILMCYAFDSNHGKDCPFLKVLEDGPGSKFNQENSAIPTTPPNTK